jgi:3-(3-hydroxy-phenyl)propionate hydroxylase
LAALAYWSMALSTKSDEVSTGGHDRGDGPDLQVSILLVGAGPSGLTLANLLGRYGASTLIIERNHSTVNEPRAVSIDDESLRTMQSIGLSQQILQTVVPGYGSDYLTPE